MSKREDFITWDEYFMGVAKFSAFRSKDPNTQVGACIVSDDNKILSMGYNGFPRGCADDVFPWGRDNSENDPYNSKYLYVTLFPCNECAKAIIQAGIKTVVYAEDKYADTDVVKASKRMLNAAGVRYYEYQATNKVIKIQV